MSTRALFAATAVAVTTGSAQAQFVNGSFETGDFTGWVATDLANPFFPLQVAGAGVSPGFGFFLSAPTDGVFAALTGWRAASVTRAPSVHAAFCSSICAFSSAIYIAPS